MRYEVKNLGPGTFFFVEAGRLLEPGDSIKVNRLDEGTRRLGEGARRRLEIVDRTAPPPALPAAPAVPVASAVERASTTPAPAGVVPSAVTPPPATQPAPEAAAPLAQLETEAVAEPASGPPSDSNKRRSK